MEDDLIKDLNLLLEESENQEVTSNVTLLDEVKDDSKEILESPKAVLRSPGEVLRDYTDKADLIKVEEKNIETFMSIHKEIFDVYNAMQKTISDLTNDQATLKDELTISLENSGLKTIANSRFKATFVASTTRSNFDKDSFKKKYPVLYNQFVKSSDVKAYTKITEVKS